MIKIKIEVNSKKINKLNKSIKKALAKKLSRCGVKLEHLAVKLNGGIN